MRCAIIADIHGNADAFEAVLKDIALKGGADELWCLGDICGYGAEPSECIRLLQKHKNVCVAGNHDLAAADEVGTSAFNPYAARAISWTSSVLSGMEKLFLKYLPETIQKGNVTLVHGSPREPVWEYLVTLRSAHENLQYFDTDLCFVGHSHLPLVFRFGKDEEESISIPFKEDTPLILKGARFIINPGSVGQSRDGDPRASYAIYNNETGEIRLYRVEYDTGAAAQKILKAGLPENLAARLARGL